MWVMIIIGLIGFFYLSYKWEEVKEESRKDAGIASAKRFKYCGGVDKVIQECNVDLYWFSDREELLVDYKILLSEIKEVIPYNNINDIVGKTEAQIRNDVTLTRLAVFGIFALGMKKQTTSYEKFIVINYNDKNGKVQNLILGGVQQRDLNLYINMFEEYKAKKEYENNKEH